MISISFPREESAKTTTAGGQSVFFNFKNVQRASPPAWSQDRTTRAFNAGAWRGATRTFKQCRQTIALPKSSAGLGKRHLLWLLLVLVLMHLSQLMAKNDDIRGNWTPPLEPPGSVIVTSLSEASQRQAPMTAPITTALNTTSSAQVNVEEAALRQALQKWSQAWSSKAISQYLEMYANDFEPPKGLNRQTWVMQRKQRIGSKQTIRHEIQDLTIQVSATQAAVQFTQIYQDERLRSSDRKSMQWVLRNGQWQITRELTD